MAIQDTMRFLLTGATSARGTGFGPNNSLGGFESGTPAYLQGSLTANMTQLGTFVDSAQVDADPAGPVDQRTPLVNDGAYIYAANLLHWYRFSYDPLLLGRDYGVGTARHLSTVRGSIASPADVDVDVQPGQFDQQRDSLHFNSAGAADNDALVNPVNEDFNIGNAWAFGVWARTTTIADGTSCLFHLRLSANLTTLAANSIRISRGDGTAGSGDDLFLEIMDTGGVNTKRYRYNSFFAANTWYFITATWNGTTLQLYKDGSPVSPSSTITDQSVTMTNTTRRLIVGGVNPNNTDPAQEWFGQIHSMMIWNTALPASAIAVVDAMGDGVGYTLDLTGEFLVFVTGNNALEVREIVFHNNATGEIRLDRPLPNLGSSGDVYRVSRTRDLWDDGPSAVECSSGLVDYRCIAFANETGGTCTDTRFWLRRITPRSIDFALAASDRSIAATALPTVANDLTAPDLRTVGAGQFANTVQDFREPINFTTADETPGGTISPANTTEYGIWLRRTTKELTRRGKSVWLLVAEAASHSVGGAGPFYSPMLLVSDPAGFTPQLSVAFDRTPRTFGGARVEATLVDATSGTPVEGVPIEIEITTGPGAISSATPQPIQTDEDGEMFVQYTGPNNEGDEGATVEATARLFERAP